MSVQNLLKFILEEGPKEDYKESLYITIGHHNNIDGTTPVLCISHSWRREMMEVLGMLSTWKDIDKVLTRIEKKLGIEGDNK